MSEMSDVSEMSEARRARGAAVLEAGITPGERARLVRLCARLSGDVDAAEDLAQETLLEAWRHAHRLADPRGTAPWLSAIARNVCLRWLRRQGRETRRMLPLDAEDAAATLPDGTDVTLDLERDELAHLLDRALALLPVETRQVLIARCIDESPQAEAAARLGLSEGALAVRLHRGKLALRRLLVTDLRDEASAYGVIAPAVDALDGWQETHIWCFGCGRRRLVGRFTPATAELQLRCPGCHAAPETKACHHISYHGLFDGVSGYKPALSRVLRWTNGYYTRALREGTAPCTHCGRPAPLRWGLPAETPLAWQSIGCFHVACAPCGYPENNSSLDFLALGLPEGQHFWRTHPRIRTLPAEPLEVAGRAALTLRFESVTDTARLEVLVAPERFDVLDLRVSAGQR